MNLKLLKVGLLCAALGLASCGSDSATTAPTTTVDPTNPASVVVVANSGTVTVTTAPNNVVSIGASGTNSKVADAAGKAVFTGLPAGPVDVHVFGAGGLSATSYYGVNSNVVNDTIGRTGTAGSVVDVYVQVVNGNLGGSYYLNDGVTTYQSSQDFITGNVTFNVDIPVGTAISATIYGANGNATSSAGNNVFGAAEVVTLGTQSLTTTAVSGAALANLTATFANPAPIPTTLATLTGVTPATGTTAIYVGLSNNTDVNPAGAAFVFPDTIASAPLPGDSSLFAFASDALGTKTWFKDGTYTQGGSVSVAATMNVFPSAAAQTGATISWTASTDTHVVEGLRIYDIGSVHQWDILAKSGVTSVTLPTPPTGVTAPLANGTTYMMDVANYAFAATYEQVIAASSLGSFDLEAVSALRIAYTR